MPDSTITDFADARANELCSAGLETGLRTFTLDDRSGMLVHIAPTGFPAVPVLSKERLEKSYVQPPKRIDIALEREPVHDPYVTSDRYLSYATLNGELYSYSSLFSNQAAEGLTTYSSALVEACRSSLERDAGIMIRILFGSMTNRDIAAPFSVRLTLLAMGKPCALPCLEWSHQQEMREFLRPAFDYQWPPR